MFGSQRRLSYGLEHSDSVEIPVYLTMVVLYLGIALIINSLWICLLVVPTVAVLHIGVIRREEHYLEGKFGEAYRGYKTQVRRWI